MVVEFVLDTIGNYVVMGLIQSTYSEESSRLFTVHKKEEKKSM